MGIVLGKPENYKPKPTVSTSAGRSIAKEVTNPEISARKRSTTRRTARSNNEDPQKPSNNNEDPRNPSEMDDIPEEIQDVMKEMGLDPEDPEDIKEFIEKTQGGGRRKKHRTRRRRLRR